MKKQILLLTFFVAAFLAGMNAYGQMKPGATATPLNTGTCTASPLNPMAGQSFDYTVTNPNGDADNYTWWATKHPNFIDSINGGADTANMLRVEPGELLNVGSGYGDITNTSATMSITWSADILAATVYQGTADVNGTPATPSPTFVVVAANGSCNNNLQVFELNPLPSFTLDIANIQPTDTSVTMPYGDQATQCVSPVYSATYSSGALDIDYGTDTLLFEVVAANFVTNWVPTFNILGGLSGNQTATIGWAYEKGDALDGNFHDGERDITVATMSDPIVGNTGKELTAFSGVNTNNGVSIYVRVVIDNNNYESTVDQEFILAVDGQDASGQWDIDQDGADCVETAADQTDRARHLVTKRPDISDGTNDGTTNASDPNTFIPKN